MSNDKKFKPNRSFQTFIGHGRLLTDPKPLEAIGKDKAFNVTDAYCVFGCAPYEQEDVKFSVHFKGKTADLAAQLLKKGMELIVEGSIRQYTKNEDGRKYPLVFHSVLCNRFTVVKWIDKKEDVAPRTNEFAGTAAPRTEESAPTTHVAPSMTDPAKDDDSSDVPF